MPNTGNFGITFNPETGWTMPPGHGTPASRRTTTTRPGTGMDGIFELLRQEARLATPLSNAEQPKKPTARPMPNLTRTLRLLSRDADGQTRHIVKVTADDVVYDEMMDYHESGAIRSAMSLIRDYRNSLTRIEFDHREVGIKTQDLRAERVHNRILPHGFSGRIDRRSIRPDEDVIAEDSLSLDIDPDDTSLDNFTNSTLSINPSTVDLNFEDDDVAEEDTF